MQFASLAFTAMGCPCELRLYAEEQALLEQVGEALIVEARRFEARYSRYRTDSFVGLVNARAGSNEATRADHEAGAILDYAAACYRESDALFDVTSGVFRRIWHGGISREPDPAAIESVRGLVGWDKVSWDGKSILLPLPDMEIDLGGIVKEYAADALAAQARRLGISHGLIDLGGDLQVVGPHPDGSPWQVGVTNPADRSGAVAVTQLLSGGIATSGSYERALEINGNSYSHIINPTTGRPAAGLKSVSVLAPQTLVAGSLATIAMLRKEEDALAWLGELAVPFVAVTGDLRCLRNDLR